MFLAIILLFDCQTLEQNFREKLIHSLVSLFFFIDLIERLSDAFAKPLEFIALFLLGLFKISDFPENVRKTSVHLFFERGGSIEQLLY